MRIAVLGGTGDEGLGLAMRFADAGHEIVIGSRSRERAEAAAEQVRAAATGAKASSAENAAAALTADIVFVSVPYAAQRPTLEPLKATLAGKVVVTVVVPLSFGKGGPQAETVPEGSAALEAQAILCSSRVASAFHNLSAHELQRLDQPVDCDVIVCGVDRETRQTVIDLAASIPGVRGIDGGPLSYSRYVEDLTALLLALNRRYKTETGIRITGLPVPIPA
ncbi:MAG TPA: NADPH-dependent F420 reductase [Dehalococcoidia bacterium]|nr:NADPH-dependent F420 reductase [Dehalococcoidia bacterium]